MKLFKRISEPVYRWAHDVSGLAATEFAMVFPIMIVLLLGIVELGNGIQANQKVIASSQIVADLLTRVEEVTDAQLEDAKNAGRLALAPFDQALVGFDIISVRYDADSGVDDDDAPDPVIVWRDTTNMDPVANIPDNVQALALEGDGVMLVYVRFPYEPPFGTNIVGDIVMIENTFSRGRMVPVVTRAE
ncbi:MAG: pilus assembly protein [Micavibrio aeruginosavorus]|uniref:Pilus assembly protein n=1 Tax=Micavibrio aeruginosavorus TaxID=349221 RepID=A0A7T5R3X5_9BACT|nr:MAG: pilus assembly protein [Micavibrio aeruginosavorus]